MKLEYLKEFVVLARSGNFHEAADDLYLARPTLSNHMRALEREVGFKLFDRSAGNKLTKAGSTFFDGMEQVLEVVDSGLEKGRAIAESQASEDSAVRISLRTSVFELRAMLDKHCPCRYTYVDYDNKKPILHSFAQGLADVMVVYDLDAFPSLRAQASGLGLHYEPYGCEPCAIAMKESNPLARGPLTRERLRGAEVAQLDAIESECWKRIIVNMLGDDLDLRFRLFPMDNLLNIRIVDLEDTVFVSMEAMLIQYFAQREGYVIRDLVDDAPLLMPRSLVYRPLSEKPGIASVLDTFREHRA
ncbi:MAG: LysR family transcriptional regulator [Gordonibacter sp.]|uniref:LysR family transcriptional regulator n=1 Tax=Gordonibacter sp. TaxID=1968902 RepID=UPI002FCAC054